jgi:hypothetical protein
MRTMLSNTPKTVSAIRRPSSPEAVDSASCSSPLLALRQTTRSAQFVKGHSNSITIGSDFAIQTHDHFMLEIRFEQGISMNKKAVGVLGVAFLTVAFAADGVLAQGRRSDRRGPANYAVASEMTVKGTVEDLKPGPRQGTHVILKTSDATLELALGPAWYQTQKKYELGKGDQIEVTGARSQVDNREVLLVREIRKGSETMTFRDAKGFPMWAGRGRR